MFRPLVLAAVLSTLPLPAHAQDAIAPETLEAVKKATVFIRVEGDGWSASGSGFVVAADDKGVFVATNEHVAAPNPPGARASGKPAKITVVFDSGTAAERSYTATVAAADPDRDLAVLRATGVKNAPKPIPYADAAKLVETMQVYTFGFPFGQALSTTKGFPAVTVGKASVSSLRRGTDGELAVVQIDGNLNPGNSGGPVVDAKGRLVGVAVAKIRDGQGIGLTIPGPLLGKMMAGRVGGVRVNSHKKADGTAAVRVYAEMFDPESNLRSPVAHYVVVPPNTKRPDAAALDKHPGSKKVELKTEDGIASAEFAVPAAAGEVLVQVCADAASKPGPASAVQVCPLAPPPKVVDLAGAPPLGWKEHAQRDRVFAMWLPAKLTGQGEEERTATLGGERVGVVAIDGLTPAGIVFEGSSTLLTPALAKRPAEELAGLLLKSVRAETPGRVAEARRVEAGNVAGEEYVIQAGSVVTRVRVFVSGTRAYAVQVTGSAEQVARKEADIILASYRFPAPAAKAPTEVATPKGVPMPKGVPAAKGKDIATPPGKEPAIIAGGGAPVFKDAAPAGGLLIGLELGLGKFGREDVIKAVRPIYRADGKEQTGTQRGTELSRVVTIKAKDGYAVGAMTHKSGLNFDGCSLTFMKVKADGKLDPKDAYESDWVGYVGTKRPGRLGGDGTPVVGIVGRAGDREVNGLGLLFKGQEGFEPGRPPAAVAGKDKIIGVEKEPFILGSIAHDPKFKTVGPEGAILVGVEVRFANFGATPIARALRPIYRVNGKEEFGEQFGKDLTGSVTLKAKDGYAVGGVTGRAGWWCNGFSLTFMKVKADGTLDPKDSYESEWAGSTGKEEVFRVVSDGPPAVGIVGKIVGTETTAFGLLFKGQEGFDPKKK